MTLREKLDALEAIEKLIKHYKEEKLPEAIRDDLKETVDGTAGPDFAGYVRDEIAKFEKAREQLIFEIQNDKNVLEYTESQSHKL